MAQRRERRANPLEPLVGYQLRRASAYLMAELARALTDLDLRPTEASVLVLIANNPGVTQSEIGRMLAIKRANMAPIAAGLERAGYLRRERVDGRSHGMTVTDAGAAAAQAALSAMHWHDEAMLARLAAPRGDDLRDTMIALWPSDDG